MATNNPTTIRIVIPDFASDNCTLIIERGELAKMIKFAFNDENAALLDSGVIRQAIMGLAELEQNPPADIQIPEPTKPTPTKTASAPVKKPVTKTPAAAKPAPKWWTNEDNGKVTQSAAKPDKGSWLGPFDSEEAAKANVPDWLKPMDAKKAKK